MRHMRKVIGAAIVGVAMVGTAGAGKADDFPQRPIEFSVWASAGGGTDTTNRYLAQGMQPHLGRINVVNRTGGGGGVAMNHVWSQPHNGYSVLGASEGMQNVKVMGYHDTSTKDWRWYMVGGALGSLSVRPDSDYKSLDDLIAAAKDNPGKIKIGHCALGCVWHMKAIALGKAAGVEFNFIPYEGSATAQTALLNGEVDAVSSSISEQAEFIKAKKFHPVATTEMTGYDFPGFGQITAAGDTYPDIQKIPAAQWLGIALPADVPADVLKQFDEAFEKAMQSDAVKRLETERFMTLMGDYGDAAMEKLMAMERSVSWTLYELGVAKIKPSDVGIPRP